MARFWCIIIGFATLDELMVLELLRRLGLSQLFHAFASQLVLPFDLLISVFVWVFSWLWWRIKDSCVLFEIVGFLTHLLLDDHIFVDILDLSLSGRLSLFAIISVINGWKSLHSFVISGFLIEDVNNALHLEVFRFDLDHTRSLFAVNVLENLRSFWPILDIFTSLSLRGWKNLNIKKGACR